MATATRFEPANVSGAGLVFGVFAALVTQILLNLLGVGLGLTAIEPRTADAGTVQWGAFTIWAISGIIGAFVGGGIAGWMAGAVDGSPGFHGLATWTITTVIVVAAASYIATAGTAVALMGGPSFARGGVSPAEAQAAASAAGPIALASFVALIIGAIAAYLGAHMAAQRETRLYPHARTGQPI